jgi:hypothetical protein
MFMLSMLIGIAPPALSGACGLADNCDNTGATTARRAYKMTELHKKVRRNVMRNKGDSPD